MVLVDGRCIPVYIFRYHEMLTSFPQIHIAGHVSIGVLFLTQILQWWRRMYLMFNVSLNLVLFAGWSAGFGGLVNYTATKKILRRCGSQLSCKLYDAVLALSAIAM